MEKSIYRGESLAIANFKGDKGEGQRRTKEVIKQDMTHLQLTKNMTLDKNFWRLTVKIKG